MATGLQVDVNQLLLNGQPFFPIGWNSVAGLYAATNPYPTPSPALSYGGKYPNQMKDYYPAYQEFAVVNATAPAMVAKWNANTVRLQVIQNVITDPGSSAAYLTALHTLVTNAEAAGLCVILCINPNPPEPLGLRSGPFAGKISLTTDSWHDNNHPAGAWNCIDSTHNTQAAWTTLANSFKTDPLVAFEIFNEPQYGGAVDQRANTGIGWGDFVTPHTWVYDHQAVVTSIRATGATNVIMVDGIDPSLPGRDPYAAGFPQSQFTTSMMLTGGGIAYAVHPQYSGYPGGEKATAYTAEWGWLADHAPVVITEFYNTLGGNWPTFASYCQTTNVGVIEWVFDDDTDIHDVVMTDKNGTVSTGKGGPLDATAAWIWTRTSPGAPVQSWMRTFTSPPPPPGGGGTGTGVAVSGNRLTLNGQPFMPVGWNSVAALWTPINPYNQQASILKRFYYYEAAWKQFTSDKGVGGGSPTCQAMAAWATNCVRLQVIPNMLCATQVIPAGSPGADGHTTYSQWYINRIQQLVAIAEANGLCVILAMNNNLPPPLGSGGFKQGVGPYRGRPTLASAGAWTQGWDASNLPTSLTKPAPYPWYFSGNTMPWMDVSSTNNTETAWRILAPIFAGDKFVLYELYNEPNEGYSTAGQATYQGTDGVTASTAFTGTQTMKVNTNGNKGFPQGYGTYQIQTSAHNFVGFSYNGVSSSSGTLADQFLNVKRIGGDGTLHTNQPVQGVGHFVPVWAPWKATMQGLINAVRASATNVIIIDATGTFRFPQTDTPANTGHFTIGDLTDTANQLAYSVHAYAVQNTSTTWDNDWGWMTATVPVVQTEFYNYGGTWAGGRNHLQYTGGADDDHSGRVANYLIYHATNHTGILGWVFDHITDQNQLVSITNIDGSDYTKPWIWTPTNYPPSNIGTKKKPKLVGGSGLRVYNWFPTVSTKTPVFPPLPAYTPNIPFWDVRVWSAAQQGELIGEVAQVAAMAGTRILDAPSNFTVDVFLSDPQAATIERGNWVEMWVGRQGPGHRKKWSTGYISAVTKSIDRTGIYTIAFDDVSIFLAEWRCSDNCAMNYPQYSQKKDGCLSLLNGRGGKGIRNVWPLANGRLSPDHMALLPPGSRAVWVDHQHHTTEPPGWGESWLTALDTGLNSLDQICAHHNIHWRLQDGSVPGNITIEIGPLYDSAPLGCWGGEELRLELARRLNVDPNTLSYWANLGEAYQQGISVVTTPQFTETYDNIWNIYVCPGIGTGADQVTLAPLWHHEPDFQPNGPTYDPVEGVFRPAYLYEVFEPYEDSTQYFVRDKKVAHWSGNLYELIAWIRQDGTFEYGIMDRTSVERHGPRVAMLSYGNKKIVDVDTLLNHACSAVDYSADPVPTWAFPAMHPRIDADGIPPLIRPGMHLGIKYRGLAQPAVYSSTGDLVPAGDLVYADYSSAPEMSDPGKKMALTRVIQVDESWTPGAGYQATYTMGHGKYRKTNWQDNIAKQLDSTVKVPPGTPKSSATGPTLDKVPIMMSKAPNPIAWEDGGTDQIVLNPESYAMSNASGESFFGDNRKVQFDFLIHDYKQAMQFIFLRPPHYNQLDRIDPTTGLPQEGYTYNDYADVSGIMWGVYAVLHLPMSGYKKYPRPGFYTTGNGTNLNPKAFFPTAGHPHFPWGPGHYRVVVGWSGKAFQATLTTPDRLTSKKKNAPPYSITSGLFSGDRFDIKDKNDPWRSGGQIGWHVTGGNNSCRVLKVEMSPWTGSIPH